MLTCYDYIIKEVAGKEVLDIGSCAEQGETVKTKTLFKALKQTAASVTGVDIESQDPEIVKGNAETVKLNKKFEVVVAGDVIEHLYNPGLFLDNMYNHLKENGALLLVTPNVKSIGYIPFRGNKYHTCWYCKNTLKYLVEQHGFKVEKIILGVRRRNNFVFDILRRLFANNLLLVCRKSNKNKELIQNENN